MENPFEIYSTFGLGGVLAFVVYKFIIIRLTNENKELKEIIKTQLEKSNETSIWLRSYIDNHNE